MNTKPHPTPESLVDKLDKYFLKEEVEGVSTTTATDIFAIVRQHESETAAERDRLRQEVAEIEYAVQAKAGAGILQQLTQGECRHAD